MEAQSEIKGEEAPQDADAPKEKLNQPLAINSRTGELLARDASELVRQIKILMAGRAFPKSMDTMPKIIAAWNLAASFKGVSPQRAISRMMYVNDRLELWGELPKALAEGTAELEDFELFVCDKEYNRICFENKNLHQDPYAAVCRIKRKGRSRNEYFFTADEAEKAGLLKKKGTWQDYAKVMLCWRAQGIGLKFEFGDASMGASISELPITEAHSEREVSSVADEINKTYLKEAPPNEGERGAIA